MNKVTDHEADPDILDEYDFSKGIRGKHAGRYAEGAIAVVLAPDVARLFPDAESVNTALHALADVARRQVKISEAA
jgi:hypothetical protein